MASSQSSTTGLNATSLHLEPFVFLFFKFIYFSWRLVTLQYCSGFCHTLTWISHGVHVFPILNPTPHLIPLGHPSAQPWPPCLMHWTWTAICFTYDNIHVSMLFSQIILSSPSPTESKRLFDTSVSLLLSRIQGYCYHLSKFRIYALVYCIGVFLSGLLHSV